MESNEDFKWIMFKKHFFLYKIFQAVWITYLKSILTGVPLKSVCCETLYDFETEEQSYTEKIQFFLHNILMTKLLFRFCLSNSCRIRLFISFQHSKQYSQQQLEKQKPSSQLTSE